VKDNYFKKIKRFKSLKYKNSPVFEKSFLKDYSLSRKLLLKKKFKKKESHDRKDKTLSMLKKIEKKNLSHNEKKYLLILYKKFEVNLKLKKDYNFNGEKKSNFETFPLSYLILAKLIYKNQLINKLQFLNFILKVIDTIAFKKKTFLALKDKQLLFKMINLEMKLVKYYAR
tara:strand:+ start:411 stop:923 length:513 start_codon:yes stop_codon:yes gene_type:complete